MHVYILYHFIAAIVFNCFQNIMVKIVLKLKQLLGLILLDQIHVFFFFFKTLASKNNQKSAENLISILQKFRRCIFTKKDFNTRKIKILIFMCLQTSLISIVKTKPIKQTSIPTNNNADYLNLFECTSLSKLSAFRHIRRILLPVSCKTHSTTKEC